MKKHLFFLLGVVFVFGSVAIVNSVEAAYPSFVHGPSNLIIGETATWTVFAYDFDGDLASITVNWGDNTSTTVPIYDGAYAMKIFTKSYDTAGIKTLNFTIKDSTGLSTRTTSTVEIKAIPSSPYFVSITGPTSTKLGATSTFIVSVADQNADLSSFNVKWGDDSVASTTFFGISGASSSFSVSHKYNAIGSYPITFSVWDLTNLSTSFTKTTTIYQNQILTVKKRNSQTGALTTMGVVDWTSSSSVGWNCYHSSCSQKIKNMPYGSNINIHGFGFLDKNKFNGWGGDCASYGSSSPCNLTMNGNKNVTAWFSETSSSSIDFKTGSTTKKVSGELLKILESQMNDLREKIEALLTR